MPDNATTEMILASWSGQYGWRFMFAAEAVLARVRGDDYARSNRHRP